MSIKSYVADPTTGRKAAIVETDKVENALVVATTPLKTYSNKIKFFTNDTYGADLNQNGEFGGTPEHVHDGTDNAYWTASDIVDNAGKFTYNSTDQNHTDGGTKSIKTDNNDVGDIFQLAKGSDMTMSGYTAVTMWVYVDKDYKLGDVLEFYGYDTTLTAEVGNRVDIKDYFNYLDYDVWQKITIPLTDFGGLATSTIADAFRLEIVSKEGKAPKMYFDDIQIEETGTPVKFSVEALKGTWLHVSGFQVIIADAIASTLADATMPNLAYDQILGETLTAGIAYKRINNDVIENSATIFSISDLMSFSNAKIAGSGSDGTNTWVAITITFGDSIVLKGEDYDELSLSVADDLTGLLKFRVGAICKEEKRK